MLRSDIADAFKHRIDEFLTQIDLKPVNWSDKKTHFLQKHQFLISQSEVLDRLPTLEQLDYLYNYTIYETVHYCFNLDFYRLALKKSFYHVIDFTLHLERHLKSTPRPSPALSDILDWIELKAFLTTESIEEYCEKLMKDQVSLNVMESEFFRRWKSKNLSSFSAEMLATRYLECTILMKASHHHLSSLKRTMDGASFTKLEDELIELCEGLGLIKAIAGGEPDFASDLNNLSMDIDTSISNGSSVNTSNVYSYNLSVTPFEAFLKERLLAIPKGKQIVELIAARCGFPFDSEDEKEFQRGIRDNLSNSPSPFDPSKPAQKHWRRVKPLTMPTKGVFNSRVKRSSSLAHESFKAPNGKRSASMIEPAVRPTRQSSFIASKKLTHLTTRQIDLSFDDMFQKNATLRPDDSKHRRRHSTSEVQETVLEHSTPTKLKYTNSYTDASNHSFAQHSSSFIILETPPRPGSNPSSNDSSLDNLRSSAKKLFSGDLKPSQDRHANNKQP